MKFIDKRKQYELRVPQKKKEILSLTAASFLVSIDPRLLCSMHVMGDFDAVAPKFELKGITSDRIKASRIKVDFESHPIHK